MLAFVSPRVSLRLRRPGTARRLLALAAIYDGSTRSDAANIAA